MENITQKIEAFGMLVQSDTTERMTKDGFGSQIAIHARVTIKPGNKYTKVDVGSSGKYMVEMASGNIFGIKAYGQVHKGHWFGTVDTTGEYFWGEYSPSKKDGSLKVQKANGYPVITKAPAIVPTPPKDCCGGNCHCSTEQ